MTPAQLMKRYQECKRIVSVDPDSFPARTKPGQMMQQTDARLEILALETEYKNFVREHAFTLVLQGPVEAQAQWAEVAKKEIGELTIRADKMYREFAQAIEPSIGERRTFGVTQVAGLIQVLTQAGKRLGLRNLGTPQLLDLSHVKTEDELVACIRTLVRASSGDDFNKAYLESEVLSKALEICYTRTVVPVVLIGATAEEAVELAPKLFTGKAFTVKAEENKPEQVLAKLGEIRDLLTKK